MRGTGQIQFLWKIDKFHFTARYGEPAGVLQIGTGSDYGALTVSAFSSVGHEYFFHVFILYKLSDIEYLIKIISRPVIE